MNPEAAMGIMCLQAKNYKIVLVGNHKKSVEVREGPSLQRDQGPANT